MRWPHSLIKILRLCNGQKNPKFVYPSIEKNIENSLLFSITGTWLIGSRSLNNRPKRAENNSD